MRFHQGLSGTEPGFEPRHWHFPTLQLWISPEPRDQRLSLKTSWKQFLSCVFLVLTIFWVTLKAQLLGSWCRAWFPWVHRIRCDSLSPQIWHRTCWSVSVSSLVVSKLGRSWPRKCSQVARCRSSPGHCGISLLELDLFGRYVRCFRGSHLQHDLPARKRFAPSQLEGLLHVATWHPSFGSGWRTASMLFMMCLVKAVVKRWKTSLAPGVWISSNFSGSKAQETTWNYHPGSLFLHCQPLQKVKLQLGSRSISSTSKTKVNAMEFTIKSTWANKLSPWWVKK